MLLLGVVEEAEGALWRKNGVSLNGKHKTGTAGPRSLRCISCSDGRASRCLFIVRLGRWAGVGCRWKRAWAGPVFVGELKLDDEEQENSDSDRLRFKKAMMYAGSRTGWGIIRGMWL